MKKTIPKKPAKTYKKGATSKFGPLKFTVKIVEEDQIRDLTNLEYSVEDLDKPFSYQFGGLDWIIGRLKQKHQISAMSEKVVNWDKVKIDIQTVIDFQRFIEKDRVFTKNMVQAVGEHVYSLAVNPNQVAEEAKKEALNNILKTGVYIDSLQNNKTPEGFHVISLADRDIVSQSSDPKPVLNWDKGKPDKRKGTSFIFDFVQLFDFRDLGVSFQNQEKYVPVKVLDKTHGINLDFGLALNLQDENKNPQIFFRLAGCNLCFHAFFKEINVDYQYTDENILGLINLIWSEYQSQIKNNPSGYSLGLEKRIAKDRFFETPQSVEGFYDKYEKQDINDKQEEQELKDLTDPAQGTEEEIILRFEKPDTTAYSKKTTRERFVDIRKNPIRLHCVMSTVGADGIKDVTVFGESIDLKDLKTGEPLYRYFARGYKDYISIIVASYYPDSSGKNFVISIPCTYPVEFSYSQLYDAFAKGNLENQERLLKEQIGITKLILKEKVGKTSEKDKTAKLIANLKNTPFPASENLTDFSVKYIFELLSYGSVEAGTKTPIYVALGELIALKKKALTTKIEINQTLIFNLDTEEEDLEINNNLALLHEKLNSLSNSSELVLFGLEHGKWAKGPQKIYLGPVAELWEILKNVKQTPSATPSEEPPHPGPYLKERYFSPNDLGVRAGAKKLKLPSPTISNLFNEVTPFTPYLAAKFESYFNEDMSVPLLMQTKRNQFNARLEVEKENLNPNPAYKRGRRPKKKTPSLN